MYSHFYLESHPKTHIKLNRHFVLLITITLWTIQQVFSSDSPSYECLAAYSKAKGLSEPEFEAITYDSTQEECTKAIAAFSAKVRSDIVEKMAEVSTDKKQTQCINGKFTNDDVFVNNIIKGEALASSNDKEKSHKLRDIEKFAEEFITASITSCIEVHDK